MAYETVIILYLWKKFLLNETQVKVYVKSWVSFRLF